MGHRLGILASCVLLTACSRPDDRICQSVPDVVATTNPATRAQVADACIQKWAYRLAQASEPVAVVADAVMGACEGTLLGVHQARVDARVALRKRLNIAQGDPAIGYDVVTGREMADQAIVYREQRAKAYFHIVQARAGRCAIP